MSIKKSYAPCQQILFVCTFAMNDFRHNIKGFLVHVPFINYDTLKQPTLDAFSYGKIFRN